MGNLVDDIPEGGGAVGPDEVALTPAMLALVTRHKQRQDLTVCLVPR